jgi:hypothetical protein
MNNDDDAQTIIDLGMMLVALLASPDAETVTEGMRHTVWEMINCAQSIRKRTGQACCETDTRS